MNVIYKFTAVLQCKSTCKTTQVVKLPSKSILAIFNGCLAVYSGCQHISIFFHYWAVQLGLLSHPRHKKGKKVRDQLKTTYNGLFQISGSANFLYFTIMVIP